MGEHLVVYVDRRVRPDEMRSSLGVQEVKPFEKRPEMVGPSSSAAAAEAVEEEDEVMEEEEEAVPLIGGAEMAECRICQDEESVNNLEVPCACSGSLKFAHRKCVQHWCNEKGDTICEICHQPYQPGYTAPPRSPPEETIIEIGDGWQISGVPLELHDPRFLAFAEAERQILEAEYEEYHATNASGAAFCRSAALILMALLLLRHAMGVTDGDGGENEDPSAIFSLFLLRVVGFLLPCYIMVWAISILQQRRQREEAAALAATQFAFVVQSAPRNRNGMQFTIASAAPSMPAAQEHL